MLREEEEEEEGGKAFQGMFGPKSPMIRPRCTYRSGALNILEFLELGMGFYISAEHVSH